MNKVFRIEYNQEVGRHAVATVDIEPGFTIIDEQAIIRGPVVSSNSNDLSSSVVTDELVCTNCFRTYSISEVNTLCCDCGRNVFCTSCAPENQTKSTLHKENECKIFQHIKQDMLNELDLKALYNLISTIRVLFIRYRDEIQWRQICSLQSKVEEFTPLGTFELLDKIFDTLSWDLFRPCTNEEIKNQNISGGTTLKNESESNSSEKSVKEIARFANGVLRVNSYSCIVGASHKMSIQFEGLYFFTALLAHSCLMNTDRQFDLNSVEGRMIVKAAVPIKKGEIISTTYLPLMCNTQERQEYMKKNWLMTCHCKRCQDETECQTHLSTVTITDERKKEEILKEINLTMPKNWNDIEAIEMWLKKYDTGKYVHPNYSVFSQVKHCLSLLYGRLEGIEVLTDTQLLRKLELCQQCLQIFVTLYPGIYQAKGELLFELWLSIRELNRRNIKSQNIRDYTEEQVAKEAHEILKFSIKNSSYYYMDKILKEY